MLQKSLLDALNGGKPISAANPLQVSDPTPESKEDPDKVEAKKE